MSDAEIVGNAIGDDPEAQAAFMRILSRRDAYVREVQAQRDEARRERDEPRAAAPQAPSGPDQATDQET